MHFHWSRRGVKEDFMGVKTNCSEIECYWNTKFKNQNLCMAWIDYRKAFDRAMFPITG